MGGPQAGRASADPAFDLFTRLVRAALGVPVALVTLVDDDEQVLPGSSGLAQPWQSMRATPLTHSVCRHVVETGQALVVQDTREEPLLAGHLAVADLSVIAYAGMPLRDGSGRVVGSLCAIDTAPRDWSLAELSLLADLAEACSRQLVVAGSGAVVEVQATEVPGAGVPATEVPAAEVPTARSAERDRRRDRLLLSLSEAVAAAEDVESLVRTVSAVAAVELGAGAVCVLAPDAGRRLRLLGPAAGAGAASPPADVLARAMRTGRFTFVEGTSGAPGAGDPAASAVLPLVAGGGPTSAAVGVLALSWPAPRRFSDEDRSVMVALARYAAQSLQRLQLLAERREVARVLQDAMLTRLPQPDHLELRARYVPAVRGEQVGGDWYDAVVLPGGSLSLAIGDVTGHDVHAAAYMGQLRNVLRTLALDDGADPAEVVQRLDQAIPALRIDTLATAVFGRIEQDGEERREGLRRFHHANAGHLPPLLLHPDGHAELLSHRPELLLGLAAETPRTSHTHDLPPGSTLLLFTDGLIERRDRPLSRGLDELLAAAGRHRELPLAEFLDALVTELVGDRPLDDCALIAVRLHPEEAPRPAEAGPEHLGGGALLPGPSQVAGGVLPPHPAEG
ncbi:GAF domain-containing SpoIIE family protein phosphatase [Kineococcus rubinsiae]|uniref:GAF domain-containing SpoIIE family protein phosphatase n=1 Tax=Kineococcus rubinsiae TaxID=2609562 RepID=UPI00142FAB72|nr:SpoIIE family protein phosphatase [Kineococcus rubinsiae]